MKLRIRAEVAATVAAAAVVAGFFWSFLVPVWDIDFWWHIATGRWIVEHGQVPATDPFGIFSNSNPVRSQTILRNYWGAQVVRRDIPEFWHMGVALRAALLGLCLRWYWRSRFMARIQSRCCCCRCRVRDVFKPQTGHNFIPACAPTFLLLDWRKTGDRQPAIRYPCSALWANGHMRGARKRAIDDLSGSRYCFRFLAGNAEHVRVSWQFP